MDAVSLSTVATYYYPRSQTFDTLAVSLAGLAMRITPASALLLLCEAKSAVELAAYLRAERGRVINHLNSPEASDHGNKNAHVKCYVYLMHVWL